MKEMIIEELLAKLMRACKLGEIIADVEAVSGGFMHRMYRVRTDCGIYAVKHLNAEIMKRPDVFENYARAEMIERKLEESDIPIVPASSFDGKKMQNIDGHFFYIFKWQSGKITDWNHISQEACYKVGNILGKIHAMEEMIVDPQPPKLSYIDWHGYALKAKAQDLAIADLLLEHETLLMHVESELNRARALLPAMQCLSNADMDPKNVMWENGEPWVIDLECLDYGNPIADVMQLALQWSGVVTCNMDTDKMLAFFDGYLMAYDNGFRKYSDMVGLAYTWVEWLEYNIQRALGNCVDEKEKELGVLEVKNTINRISYIYEMEPQIKAALEKNIT